MIVSLSSAGGIRMEFHTEGEARSLLLDSKRKGTTRNWHVGRTVTMPFAKTQPPQICEGIEFQPDL
jgi:hypothetical protein